jgi:magnesium-transporting ATPase (P-type)
LQKKGSDDALLPRCSSGNAASQLLAFDRFAERGLRTLAVARRIVDESVVQRSGVLQARAQLDGGLALEQVSTLRCLILCLLNSFFLLIQSFESLERLMELLGCVGIRDELQQNAVATIENLRLSRRFWILSGDKKQTLVCLAKSCGLSEVRDVDAHRNDEISESDDQTLHIAGTQFEQLSLPTQNRILRASCVIVSRCSPSQKALIVELLRRAGNVVCAIGDGGNDVSMIRVANIGIGLSGKEGAQASLAADFALPNFNALNSLLDVGKLAFARVFFIACYCFYKSFVLALLQALFGFLSLFSGVSLFSTLQLMLYNVLFTSLPVVLRVFDPSPPPTRSFRFSLLLWIARAAFQAVVVFLFCVLLADEASDLNLVAESAYLAVVATVSLTLLCESSAPTILWAFAVPAVPFSAVVLFVLSSIPGVREFGATPSLSGGLAALGATVVALFPFVLLKFGSIFSRRRAAEKFSDNELDFDL